MFTPFSPETKALVPAWKARKKAQWERVAGSIHGLQLATSGEAGTHYMLTCSFHDDSFYESIVFGQLPEVVLEAYGSPLNPMYRDMDELKKPLDKRLIDLADDQIDQVLARWKEGQSAHDLPFLLFTHTTGAKLRLK
jgi:hypothetical protein